MSVRFKFKNDLDYQPIPCDGFHISVRDLKRSIIRSKKFGKVTDFDLVVTNSQTNQVYLDDNELISKNTTLIVQRAPLGEGKKKVWEDETSISASIAMATHSVTMSGIPGLNLSNNSADSEDDKISKMMTNSSEMYSEKHWTKFKGQKALPDGSKPPPHWKCSKCLANHWVSDCPFANNDMKRTTGIPRSFLKPAESNVPGAKINPQGLIVVNEMEKLAYSEKKVEKNPWLPDDKPAVAKVLVPTELLCPICKDLLKDAVMMPCCAGSACDECARNGILDSEGSRCPVCTDVANPEELIPYRLFRDKVDKFRNQTGYTKATPTPPAQLLLSAKPTLPDIVLPDPADVNFQFDALVGHRATPGVKVEPPNINFVGVKVEPTNHNSVQGTSTQGPSSITAQTTPGSPITDSPRGTSPPRQHLPPRTPTSTPPRSPGTPTYSPERSHSSSKDSRSSGTPYSRHNGSGGRGTPTPTTSPQHSKAPLIDTSVPPPMYSGAPGPTLLPPGHVLAPASHFPPPPPQLAPAPAHYHQPTTLNPAEDPLAAFEAAMRKLDSKKASRGRLGPSSPPRAYRVDRPRSRSRERYRDYREREYSPRRRSPGGYRGYSPRRGMSPRRADRGLSRGSGPRTPSPFSAGNSRNSLIREGRTGSPGSCREYRGDSHGSGSKQRKERYVTDIPPETEEERRDRERFERELAERERYQGGEREDQYSNYRKVERSKGRVAPTPPREFLEREMATEYRGKDPDNRTPSLSPEPGTDQHKEYVRGRDEKQREERENDVRENDVRDKDIRDKDVRIKEENHKDERTSHIRDEDKEYIKSNERDKEYSRTEAERINSHERPRERNVDRSRESEGNRPREEWEKERDVRDHDRSRDRDVRDHDRSRDRDVRDHDRSRDRDVRDHDRSRDRDVRDHDRSRDRDVRDHDRDRDVRDHDRTRDRGREREKSRHNDRADHNISRGRERSREAREKSRERQDRSREKRDRSRDGFRPDHPSNNREDRSGHEEVSEHRADEHKQDEKKESKKEKKPKKSKKKNKKKDKDSDSDEEGKENRKKKKKSKKKKDKDPESNDEQKPECEVKPLVPYSPAAEEAKTAEESSENQEEKPPVDPTKFINSFCSAKVEDSKPNLNLPTLVFNDKTIELAPKENNSVENDKIDPLKTSTSEETSPPSKPNTDTDAERKEKVSINKRDKKGLDLPREKADNKLPETEAVPSVSSKWDRDDILTTEYPEMDHPLVNNPVDPEYSRELDKVKAAISGDQELTKSITSDPSSGPQNVLRKALANMEKDNIVREKKRKSLEVSDPELDSHSKKKKKKKKKKVETEDESSEEESKGKTKKRNKKKKKGGLEIPEKTLKKLLKKNLLKKKALEKLISGDSKKKRKKRNSGEASDLENRSEERIKADKNESGRERKRSRSKDRKAIVSERIVRRRDSHSEEKKAGMGASEERERRFGRKDMKRDTSEEGREVKSSREGNIQVRLDNTSSNLSSAVAPSRSSLTSTVQANLLKMAGQVANGREGEERDRGRGSRRDSPPRKSIKDRLGPFSGGDSSPVRRDNSRSKVDRVVNDRRAVKDRLGGSKERGGKEVDVRDGSGLKREDIGDGKGSRDRRDTGVKPANGREKLGAVPADLQAWALKATLVPSSPAKQVDTRERKKSPSLSLSSEDDKSKSKRRRSVSRGRKNNSKEGKKVDLSERRRSNSREKRRKTPSEEKKSKKERKREKKRLSQDSLPVKKRKNQRLTNDVDRSFNSESE